LAECRVSDICFFLIEAWSFLMKKQLILAAGILTIVSMPFAAQAQGVAPGMRTSTDFSAQEKKKGRPGAARRAATGSAAAACRPAAVGSATARGPATLGASDSRAAMVDAARYGAPRHSTTVDDTRDHAPDADPHRHAAADVTALGYPL
jgi:hypothetical protein